MCTANPGVLSSINNITIEIISKVAMVWNICLGTTLLFPWYVLGSAGCGGELDIGASHASLIPYVRGKDLDEDEEGAGASNAGPRASTSSYPPPLALMKGKDILSDNLPQLNHYLPFVSSVRQLAVLHSTPVGCNAILEYAKTHLGSFHQIKVCNNSKKIRVHTAM